MLLILTSLLGASSGHAKNTYETIIKDPQMNIFPSSDSMSLDEHQENNRKYREALADFKRREDRMIELKKAIEQHGHSAIDFLQRMQTVVDSMSEAQRRHILLATDEEIARLDSEELRQIFMILREVEPQVTNLFRDLDDYIQDSLDMSIALTLHGLRKRISALKPGQQTADIRGLYKKLIHAKDTYVENKIHYGQGKDTHRTKSYQAFFRTAQDLFSALDSPGFTRFKRIAKKLGKLVDSAVWLVQRPQFAWNIVKTVTTILRSPQPTGTTNPVIRSAMQVSRQFGEELEIPVAIEGGDNLRFEGGVDEVFIITPSHRDMWKDQIALAHLGYDDLVPFAAAHVYPKIVVQRMGLNLGVIPVGSAAPIKPIPRAIQIAKQTDLRVFVNYPGGRLPEGIGATMGVREKFFAEDGLVRAFENEGFKVHLVPVSFRDNAKLFGTRTLTRNEQISIKVGPHLRHETRQLITRLAGHKSIALMMRYGLIEDLVTNDELLWGKVRGSKLGEAMSEFLLGKCESGLLE